MSSRQTGEQSSLIEPLTGVRGYAAIWVVLYHCRAPLDHWLLSVSEALRTIVWAGFLGVDLFAVLSGFVISLTYAERLGNLSLSGAAHFLWLRLARIYPLLVFVLGLFAVSHLRRMGMGSWGQIWTDKSFWLQALMLNGWGLESEWAWNVPSWSVSSEWLSYLLFPLLAPMIVGIKSGRLAAVLAGAAILGTIAAMVALGHPDIDADLDWGFVRIGGEFLTGCLLYRAYASGVGKNLPWGAIGMIAVCVGLYACTIIQLWVTVISFVILVYALAHHGQPLAWIFSNRVSLYLGEISYSIYMVQWFVISEARFLIDAPLRALPVFPGVPILLGVILVLASATHFAVERPTRSWMRKLVDR